MRQRIAPRGLPIASACRTVSPSFLAKNVLAVLQRSMAIAGCAAGGTAMEIASMERHAPSCASLSRCPRLRNRRAG